MARSLLLVSTLLLLILNVQAKTKRSSRKATPAKPPAKVKHAPAPAPAPPKAPTQDDWKNYQFPPWFFYPPNGPQAGDKDDKGKPPYVPPPPPPGPVPPNYGDFNNNPSNLGSLSGNWAKWSDLGGPFRNQYAVAYGTSPSTTDFVVATNRKSSLKVKTVTDAGAGKWLTLGDANPDPSTSGYITEGIAASVDNAKLYVYGVGSDNGLYEGSAALPSLSSFSWTTTAVDTVVTGAPAAVTLGATRFVFVTKVGTGGARTLTGWSNSGTWAAITTLAGPSETFSNPTAAVYSGSSNTPHVVVAVVSASGDLYISDSPVPSTTITINPLAQTDVKCIDDPHAVTVGKSVEIYCRGGDFKFYCVTVVEGEDPDYRTLDESTGPLPISYAASYRGSSVYLYSRTEDGRIGTKKFK